VHAHQDASGGRWVPTFANDVQPGDTIRLAEGGPARLIVDRDYPDSWARNLRIVFRDGTELVGKTQRIEIWDTDSIVTQRIQDLSAAAIR
jgi:hypothetical protein